MNVMKQLLFTALLILALGNDITAQERLRFSSINQVGILKGNSDQTYQLQTINGVSYRTWFAGIGVGMEEYYLKTFPLFIEVRRDLFSKRATPFIYADLGVSFPSDSEEKTAWQRSEYKKGMYYDCGIGYSIPIKGSLSFNFSAGYSLKETHESRYYHAFWDFPPYDGDEWNKEADYDFTFRRISIKAALRF